MYVRKCDNTQLFAKYLLNSFFLRFVKLLIKLFIKIFK